MPQYWYKFSTSEGEIIYQEDFFHNDCELLQAIQKKEGFLIDFSHMKVKFRKKDFNLSDFCFFMKYLLFHKIPLMKAIEIIAKSIPSMRFILINIMEDLQCGISFTKSLKNFPTIFNETVIELINIGETTGKLGYYFDKAHEYCNWHDQIKNDFKKNLRYPCFLLICVFGLVYFMTQFLMPEVQDFLLHQKSDKELPFLTTSLLKFTVYFYYVVFVFLILLISIYVLTKISKFLKIEFIQYQIEKLIFLIPIFGEISFLFKNAINIKLFSALVEEKVQFSKALTIVTKANTNLCIKEKWYKALVRFQGGYPLYKGFDFLGSIDCQIIKFAEENNILIETLHYMADKKIVDIKERLKLIMQFLEPVALFVLGGFILWVIGAVLVPMYDSLLIMQH